MGVYVTPSQEYSNYNLSLKYHNCNSINAQLQLSALLFYFPAKNDVFHRQRRHPAILTGPLVTFLSHKFECILTQKVAYQIEGHFLLLPSSSSLLKYETVGKWQGERAIHSLRLSVSSALIARPLLSGKIRAENRGGWGWGEIRILGRAIHTI